MKGRRPATSRISDFYRRISCSKGKKRTIIWLQIAVLFLVVANPFFWKICNWLFKNYGPLDVILTYVGGWQILLRIFVKRERKKSRKGRRRTSKKR